MDTGRSVSPSVIRANTSHLNQWEAYLNGYPTFDLTGQIALVTGAARGLGNAISLALAYAGADVALGLRDAKTHTRPGGSDRSDGPKSVAVTDGHATP